MRNCLIAQSGGPTAVINSSVIGVVEENNSLKYFDTIYAGINGIEGILNKNIIDLTKFSEDELEYVRFTPSSALGSCRYKLKNYTECNKEYKLFFHILDQYSIDTFFYVGGNDSMDTVAKLSEYAELNCIDKRIIGIPKTIDNDLMYTDHTPGFGSAAKLIATLTLETYLDSSVYTNNGIFILETMGRDTGWLAASSALAKLHNKAVADFIYLPEKPFSSLEFLLDVRERFENQNQVYIVVSEGLRDISGNFLAKMNSAGTHDNFGHAQLGGVAGHLKNLIVTAGITSRVKTLELGVIQRCAMHIASQVDLDEAFDTGRSALRYATSGVTGYMIGIKRTENSPYISENFLIKANMVCNKVKYFPSEWINERGNNITEEALSYLEPLIAGSPDITYNGGIPKYHSIAK
jgi:ATP-dependent phosphofructokinase / diphosphate-dependent phosphofructokinase